MTIFHKLYANSWDYQSALLKLWLVHIVQLRELAMQGNRIDRYAHRLRSKILKRLVKRLTIKLGFSLQEFLRRPDYKQCLNARGFWDKQQRARLDK